MSYYSSNYSSYPTTGVRNDGVTDQIASDALLLNSGGIGGSYGGGGSYNTGSGGGGGYNSGGYNSGGYQNRSANDSEVEAFFDQLDKNHNGSVTFKEAHDTLLNLSQRFGKPYKEKDLKAFFQKIDLNHDGKLSIRELKNAYIRGEFSGTAKEIGDRSVNNNDMDIFFEQLDKNHNGLLTYKEAHDALLTLNKRFGKPYTEKDLKAFFQRVDLNHDKKLSTREFKNAILSGAFGGASGQTTSLEVGGYVPSRGVYDNTIETNTYRIQQPNVGGFVGNNGYGGVVSNVPSGAFVSNIETQVYIKKDNFYFIFFQQHKSP
jgi:Ca2+-binding EF-hand superfamily protein